MLPANLHTLDMPGPGTKRQPDLHALSTLEAELLRRLATADEPEPATQLYLHTALEQATARSLTRGFTCASTLAAPLYLDLALPDRAGDRPLLGAQVRSLNLSHPTANLDLLTREVRAAAFTSIELKAAHGPIVPIHSLRSWCHEARPKYFALWCIRVDDDGLLEDARALLNSLSRYCDEVGGLFYRKASHAADAPFEKRAAPELSLGHALRELALEMLAMTAGEQDLPRASDARRHP